MNAFTRACLVALPFLATPALVHAWCLPTVHVDAGVNAHLNGYIGPGFGAQLGPWYSYFPYNAHFATPAPVGGWPYWPTGAAVSIPPQGVMPEAPNQMPNVEPTNLPNRNVRPIGYYGEAPSYWYGR